MTSRTTKGAISGDGGHGDEGVVGRWLLGAFVGTDPTLK
jgi:hypothetical protein